MKKHITILGSTGSIGTQSLQVIQDEPDKYEILALSAWKDLELLKEQILKFKPKYAVVRDDKLARELKNNLNNKINCHILYGEYGLTKISTLTDIDTVIVAITGMAALKPTLEAINAKKQICLANKEIIVSAGEIIMKRVKDNQINIIPIDSEHSGLFQCITPEHYENIEKLIITASGGPFYHLKESALESVSVEEALNHPNWQMGKKISIDSATLMNKGLEVIEAFWLFGVPLNKIEVLVHPQSYIHSLVQYDDGSMIAQLSNHDMRIPIHFALNYPNRARSSLPRINLVKIGQLTFKKLDTKKFPSIDLCYKAIEQGGTLPVVLNAANEVAVSAFLNRRLSFGNIIKVVSLTMEAHQNILNPTINDIIYQDREARKMAEEICKENK
ncbi:MAG: 1-deoxy-D-xylulose-5-phosphate reductoisomerase [Atribacterota bacterium]|jgi:1-deoxy-D-xylulose-5-phosphate reductoisomerase|nr:1-deoxy-D-xylulose-5-phosphate reductoisomerase [Atribacterota bacterium]MDY0382220.1 1-deoxy-D-xylulose-5-phosphate reductoisomerase [Atribacterota bacterium]